MSDTTVANGDDTKRQAVGKHTYLDAEGVVTKNIMDAVGVQYQHITTGKVLKVGTENAALARAAACFGLRTKLTNIVSAATDRDNGGMVDWDEVNEQVAELLEGEWPSRGGDGEGPASRLNKDALAEAVVLTYEENEPNHPMFANGRDALQAKVREKLESDKGWAIAARRQAAVHYVRLTGKGKPTKDLLAKL